MGAGASIRLKTGARLSSGKGGRDFAPAGLDHQPGLGAHHLHHGSLLDAAHIVPDTEPAGIPTTPNGLALCKIHHAAYDQNMLGVSPDYKVSINREVLAEVDGPMLKHGLQEMRDGHRFFAGRPGLWTALDELHPLQDPNRLDRLRAAVIAELTTRGWRRVSEPRGSAFILPG